MGKRKVYSIFLSAIFVPYIVIFALSVNFFLSNFSKYSELKNLKEVIEPIKSLSEIILLLNRDKVFTILKTLDKEIYVKISKRYESGLSGLDEKVKNLKKVVMNKKNKKKYCLCKEVANLDHILAELHKANTKDIKIFLYSYNNLINKLCSHYAELSSKLSLKFLSLQFKTIYNLHKFHTVVSDFVAEQISSFYQTGLRSFRDTIYHYRGKIFAYADTFQVFIDFPDLKEEFKVKILQNNLLQNLLMGGNYTSFNGLLEDFIFFENSYSDFHDKILKKLLKTLNKSIEQYRLKTFEVLFLAAIGLISLLIVNYIVYRYGISQVESTIQKLKEKSFKDPLTGLLNRRFFNTYLSKKMREERSPISFILLDLDNFKWINDTYGHDFGDKVLRHVARILKNGIRKDDIAVRVGGEEFGIFVKGHLEVAEKLAERIRRKLENSPVDGVKITASFGVGEYRGEDPKEFFRKVDEALYRAKRNGKNRVEKAT